MKKYVWLMAGILSFAPALAGIKLRMDTREQNGSGSLQSGWIYAEGENRLRIDVDIDPDTGQPENSMIFHADEEVLYMVDHIEKRYARLDRHVMETFSDRFSQAMEQMQAELEKLPEGQRKVMEDMIKKNMPHSGSFEVEVRDVGMDGEYHKYETWISGEKRSEVWVRTLDQVGLPENSLVVFRKLSTFYEQMLNSLSNNPWADGGLGANPFPGFLEMKGLPVRIVHMEEEVETRLSDVQVVDLPDAFFQPPSDYVESSPDVH